MFIDRGFGFVEKLCHLILGEPDGFFLPAENGRRNRASQRAVIFLLDERSDNLNPLPEPSLPDTPPR